MHISDWIRNMLAWWRRKSVFSNCVFRRIFIFTDRLGIITTNHANFTFIEDEENSFYIFTFSEAFPQKFFAVKHLEVNWLFNRCAKSAWKLDDAVSVSMRLWRDFPWYFNSSFLELLIALHNFKYLFDYRYQPGLIAQTRTFFLRSKSFSLQSAN